MLASLKLLEIQIDDIEVRRKGSLLQALILVIVSLSVFRSIFDAFLPGDLSPQMAFLQIISSLIFGSVCLAVIHQGQIELAAHIFFSTLNLILFIVLITTTQNFFLPYLMLISVVAIATMVSIRASVVYGILTITGISAFFLYSESFTFFDVIAYVVTCLGISIAAWSMANYSQTSLRNSKKLSEDLLLKSTRLERQAKQLQLGTEIAQKRSGGQELPQLLKETVSLLKSEFGFPHIAIYLVGDRRKELHRQELASENQADLIGLPLKIPIDNHSAAGWSALHRAPRLVNDSHDGELIKAVPTFSESGSELALPLVARGELLGVLNIIVDKANPILQEDIAILQIIANQIAINIDIINLIANAEARLNETRILYEFNSLLTGTQDVGELFRRAARALSTWLDCARCTLYSWDSKEQTVTAQADFWVDLSTGNGRQYSLDLPTFALKEHEDLRQTLESGRHKISEVEGSAPEKDERATLAAGPGQTCLDIPLTQRGKSLGLVRLYRSLDQSAFSDSEIQLAQAMANETAVALANATLTSETQARVAQLSSLNRLSRALSEAPYLDEVYKSTRREILSLVEATGLAIALLEDDEKHLSLLYLYDYGKEIDLTGMSPLSVEIGFSGYVARSRTILHIHATPENQAKFNSFQVSKTDDFNEYWLGLPLVVTNKLIGVLSLQNLEPFSQRDIELLTTVAGTLAIAINNLLQLEAVQTALAVQFEQRLQIQTAAEVAAAATSILDMNILGQRSVELIKERFGLYYVGLFLVEGRYAVLKAGTGEAGEVQLAAKRQLEVGGQSLIGGATKDGRPRITQDVNIDPEWLPNPHLPETRSELALPLRVRDKTIGALTVQSIEPYIFSDDLIGSLQIMGDQLAVAIENAQLLAKAEARAQRQAYLNQISAQLHQSADVETIIGIGLRALSQELDGAAIELQLGRKSVKS